MNTICVKTVIYCLLIFFSRNLQAQTNLLEWKIDSLMQAHVIPEGKHPVHHFMLYAQNPDENVEFFRAFGTLGSQSTPVDPDHQYNIASITKTLVAVIILQLEEEGKLNIRDKVGTYVADLDFLRFSEFHHFQDTAYAQDITIEMLLNHTSGIADVFTDAETRFNLSVFFHKKRQYTPQTFLEKYFQYKLHHKSFFKPGQGYHYSDINYMVLGFLIEKLCQQKLHEAIRKRILLPLQLHNTYFLYYEPPCGKKSRLDEFINKINITQKVNTSYEWAGGGLISSTQDMGRFFQALVAGKLFQKPATLAKMLDTRATQAWGGHYGLGVYAYQFGEQTYYGHGGFYGSITFAHPQTGFVFSAHIGQSNPPFSQAKLIAQFLKILEVKPGK